MPEDLSTQNDSLNSTDTHITSRILSDAELIKSGAVIVGGVLHVTNEQRESIDALHAAPQVEQHDDEEQASVAEEMISPEVQEKISRWLDTMPASLHTWLARDVNIPPEFHAGSVKASMFTSLYSQPKNPGANILLNKLTGKGLKDEAGLKARDIPEVFEVLPIQGAKTDRLITSDGQKIDEAFLVLYGAIKPFRSKVSGNKVELRMIMPKTEAEELRELVAESPKIARLLLEKLMTEKFHAVEAWENSRPPYEQWEAEAGGISKMAVRTDVMTPVSELKVIEF